MVGLNGLNKVIPDLAHDFQQAFFLSDNIFVFVVLHTEFFLKLPQKWFLLLQRGDCGNQFVFFGQDLIAALHDLLRITVLQLFNARAFVLDQLFEILLF